MVGPAFDNDGAPEIIIEHQTPAGNLVVAVALPGLQGQEENARLIAAAPELLVALSQMVFALEGKRAANAAGEPGFEFNDALWAALQPAREAIAKAGGELFNTISTNTQK